jgi:hypothetical protein
VERARLTMMLSKMHEERGAIAEASETLQEIAVETYGSMEKREKAEFLLEQVRLTLAQRDLVRAGILAGKMNKKVLDEPGALRACARARARACRWAAGSSLELGAACGQGGAPRAGRVGWACVPQAARTKTMPPNAPPPPLPAL